MLLPEFLRPGLHLFVVVHQREAPWINIFVRVLRPELQRHEPDGGVRILARLGKPTLPGLALSLFGFGLLVDLRCDRWGSVGLDTGVVSEGGGSWIVCNGRSQLGCLLSDWFQKGRLRGGLAGRLVSGEARA